MLWRGRRESLNIIDLRNAVILTIGINWVNNDGIPPGILVIDTDGTLYANQGEKFYNHAQIGLVSAYKFSENSGKSPDPTVGQIQTLDNVISRFVQLSGGGHRIAVNEPETEIDIEITQLVQSFINNG